MPVTALIESAAPPLVSPSSLVSTTPSIPIFSSKVFATFLEAANGQDAIDIYKKESPSLVFLDIVMPIKDGNAVIHEITDFDPDATIIIVSSVGTQSQLREAIEAGASDFIQKPINADQIEHIITSRFEGR